MLHSLDLLKMASDQDLSLLNELRAVVDIIPE